MKTTNSLAITQSKPIFKVFSLTDLSGNCSTVITEDLATQQTCSCTTFGNTIVRKLATISETKLVLSLQVKDVQKSVKYIDFTELLPCILCLRIKTSHLVVRFVVATLTKAQQITPERIVVR